MAVGQYRWGMWVTRISGLGAKDRARFLDSIKPKYMWEVHVSSGIGLEITAAEESSLAGPLKNPPFRFTESVLSLLEELDFHVIESLCAGRRTRKTWTWRLQKFETK